VFLSGQQEWPPLRTTGLVFAGLAGVAGAVGAICVILSTSAAVSAATRAGLPKETFKIYIAPLIFGLAPVINTLVSSAWHPKRGAPFGPEAFALHLPGWKLWVGILLVGLGAALVLFSKEEAETKEASAKKPAPAVAAAPPAQATPEAQP